MTADTLNTLLAQALAHSGADMGNIQLMNPQTGALQIVASTGFRWRFLSYFDSVHTGQAACGAALGRGQRTVVEDVAASPMFDEASRNIVLDAGARAVQSTPLRDTAGRVIGMLSTHRREAGTFSSPLWAGLDELAARASRLVMESGMLPGSLLWSTARSRVLLESTRQLLHASSTWQRRETTP